MSIGLAGDRERQDARRHRHEGFEEIGRFRDTPIYDRALLVSGDRFTGPAIVEEPDSTTIGESALSRYTYEATMTCRTSIGCCSGTPAGPGAVDVLAAISSVTWSARTAVKTVRFSQRGCLTVVERPDP